MPSVPASLACCDRCVNLSTNGLLPTGGQAGAPGWNAARRRLLKAAVRPQPEPDPGQGTSATPGQGTSGTPGDGRDATVGFADDSRLPRTVSGTVLDVSPQ